MSEDANNTASETFNARQELYSLSGKASISIRKKKKIIEKLDAVYGYDLVQIISIISSGKMSGYLNIVSEKNKIYGITFFFGDIIQIDNADQKTYLGNLLVSENFISAEELQATLKNQANSLGQTLIKSGKISRENLIYVLNKQIKLRLTQLINSNIIKVNFSEAEVHDSEIKISSDQMLELTQEWVFSCITDQWLTLHYLEWQNCEIEIQTEKYERLQHIKSQMSELVGPDFFEFLESNPRLANLDKKFNKELSLRIIHLFVLLDCIDFKMTSELESKDLSLFIKQLKSKQPNEILNLLALFTKTSVDNYEKIYENLIDKVGQMESDIESKNELFKLGLDIISNPKKYMTDRVINKKIDEEMIKHITTEARNLILKKEYYLALSTLKQLKEEQLNFPKVELNFVWSLLAQAIDLNLKINLMTIKNRISRIRPEDKYEADYFYVMALYNKYLGHKIEAQAFYQKSCTKDAHFKQYPLYAGGLIGLYNKLSEIKIDFKKKSVILIILGAALEPNNASAQANNPLVIEVHAPIEYTNQFFSYDVTSKGIQIENLRLQFDDIPKFIDDLEMQPQDDGCYTKTSRYTDLKFCPPMTTELKSPQFDVEVNEVDIDPKGIVILQDIENKLSFSVKLNKKKILMLNTVKRVIVPYTVNKDAESSSIETVFIDLRERKNAWKKTLDVEDQSYKIMVGDFLYPTQDFQFKDKNIYKNALDYKVELPKEFKIVYNRIGANLLLGFSQFKTKSSTYNSTLNSTVGLGVKFLYEYNLNERNSIYTNLIFYNASISSEKNAIPIDNKNYSLFDYNVGYKTYFDLEWALSFELNIRNEFQTIKIVGTPDVFAISKSNSISLGAMQEFTFFETARWNLILDIGPQMILPHKTELGTTELGWAGEGGTKLTYKLREGRIYGGISYEERLFKANEYSFNNKDFLYVAGFYYLF